MLILVLMKELQRRSGLKKLGFRLGAFVLGIIALVAILEIFLRVSAALLPDPVVRIDSEQKAAGKETFEIFCIGDSHTYGKGAPKGYSYPDQLWRLLQKANPNIGWHLVNTARPGWNSSQALNALKRRMQGSPGPNLVLMCAGHNNDHNLTQASILPDEIMKKAPTLQWAYVFRNSRTFRLSQITIRRIRELVGTKHGVPDSIYDSIIEGTDEFLANWVYRDMNDADRLCKANGSQLVLVGYAKGAPQTRKAMKQMREQGVPAIDNYDFGLSIINTRVDLMSPDGHPNARGYARIAYRAARFLAKNNLIPVTEERMKEVTEESGF